MNSHLLTGDQVFKDHLENCRNPNLLIRMFKSLGVYIPFSILVEKCWRHMDNRRHALVQVQKILTELGVSSKAFQASADELHRLRPPFFCLIGKAGEEVLSVVLEIEGDVVFFDQGFAEMRSLPMCDVQPLWRGLAVVPKPTKSEIDSITNCSRTNDERRLSYFLSNLSVESDFLLPADCENIIEEASTRFNRSIVGHKYRISESRTSYSANLMGIVPHIYREIYHRARGTIGDPDIDFEPIQCVRYEEYQKYESHFDPNMYRIDEEQCVIGYREWTLLIYLNDSFKGGKTIFPLVKKAITPQRGTALLFRIRDVGGHVNPYSLHTGAAVREGTKYAVNVWSR